MKKFILLIILNFYSATTLLAQEKKITLAQKKIGTVNCKYISNVTLTDTTNHFFLSFQNAHYKSIVDLVYISLYPYSDSSEVLEFVHDLKDAFKETGTKQTIHWNKENYLIAVYDFAAELYLIESLKKGNGYTTLTKKEVETLILWFEELGYK
jgi:hypothetical protein